MGIYKRKKEKTADAVREKIFLKMIKSLDAERALPKIGDDP